ncbi:MAG: hypothetical protein ACYTKD_30750 [Planctomycetota bacterium]|jgi:hypothetical protein
MTESTKDREIVRDLAKRVAEIAALPVQAERRELWTRHNDLAPARPMILVFPEGSWRELLPDSGLECEDKALRGIERGFRQRIYYHEHIHDDTVIESGFTIGKAVRRSGWGLQAKRVRSTEARGAWGFDPVINEPADLAKLRHPEVTHDEKETARRLESATELLGDILDVELRGIAHISFHLMSIYIHLRGLAQVMLDMYENPAMLHDAMAFLEEGYRGLVRQYVEQNLLSLNNDGTYHSSGGVGYTTQLPKPDHDPERVRPVDMWASAESQEMAQVSPEFHEEFATAYERRLLEPFGLTGYGCCEDLTRKLDNVFRIPNMRRISISPFADVEKCAEKLRGNYVFSWKPHPSHLVGTFDADAVRGYIAHALEATGKCGCVLEMVLKATHTCENHPERVAEWTRIAREEVERATAS